MNTKPIQILKTSFDNMNVGVARREAREKIKERESYKSYKMNSKLDGTAKLYVKL